MCTKTRDGEQPSQGGAGDAPVVDHRPSTTWTHQICRDTGVSATEALQLAEDRPFWRTIATAGGSGWTLRVTMDGLIDENAYYSQNYLIAQLPLSPESAWFKPHIMSNSNNFVIITSVLSKRKCCQREVGNSTTADKPEVIIWLFKIWTETLLFSFSEQE